MRKNSSSVPLFNYLDYRQYLRDWYAKSKKSRASVSFRTFSKRAGFKSTNFFKLVMEGERNLTEESLLKFALGLSLNKQETEFFKNLVHFTQATTHAEKDTHYQQLIRSKKFSQLKPIDKQQYEYYSAWYHPVIRELIVSKNFDGTPTWVSRRLFPSVTEAQVEKSFEILEKLGLVEKTSQGQWKQTSTLLSTGAEVSSLVIMNYHKNLLDLTKEILEKVPSQQRDVSTMTLGVTKERLPQIKRKVQEFRQEILKLVSMDTEPEEVLQLNIQLFPVTRTDEDEK